MEGFLKFIFFAILTVYVLGWLGRMLLRWWLVRKQKEFARRFSQGDGDTYTSYRPGGKKNERRSREGEVNVRMTRRSEKKVSEQVGDYVDYEEIVEE